MRHRISKGTLTQLLPFMVGLLMVQTGLYAQGAGGRQGGPPPTPKAAAPIDLTGYWVSVVTEDWRYRMVMPLAGDYQGVPMTPAARKVADTWDLEKEKASPDQCKSFGAPSLLRVPGRLHITWQDDQTLRMDTDAGKQTRVFHFGNWQAPAGPATLQGDSVAQWELPRPGDPRQPPPPPDPNAPPPTHGSLKVTTTHLKGGYLRKNGVPYSDNANLMEYYDLLREHNGDLWMVVTTVTTDPMYLREPFMVSTHFKKQPSDAGWNPTACSATW